MMLRPEFDEGFAKHVAIAYTLNRQWVRLNSEGSAFCRNRLDFTSSGASSAYLDQITP
jgi:hypothetical protein